MRKVAELRQATERNEAASDQGGESPEASGVEPAREAPAKGAGPQSVVVTSAWQSPESLQDESGDSVVDHSRPMEGSEDNANEAANVDSVLSRLVKSGLWRKRGGGGAFGNGRGKLRRCHIANHDSERADRGTSRFAGRS